MSKVCEHHADVMTQTPEITSSFIQTLINSLKDRPKISQFDCIAIEKLAESLQPENQIQKQNAITGYFQILVQSLMENALRQSDSSDVNLINTSYAALIALVQFSCEESTPIISEMLMYFLTMLEQSTQNQGIDTDRNEDTQNMIFCLLQVILVRVGGSVSTEIGEKIVQLIILIFQNIKKVSQNGLIAYGGLCQGLQDRVNVKDFGQYILWALKGDDEDCARVACGIVSDIATAFSENVHIYLTSFVPPLL